MGAGDDGLNVWFLRGHEPGQLFEPALKASGREELQDRSLLSGWVPESVRHTAAHTDDPSLRDLDDVVPDLGTNAPGEHVDEPVFVGVRVQWPRQCARLKGLLGQRERAICFLAGQHHPQPRVSKIQRETLVRLNDVRFGSQRHGNRLRPLPEMFEGRSPRQDCSASVRDPRATLTVTGEDVSVLATTSRIDLGHRLGEAIFMFLGGVSEERQHELERAPWPTKLRSRAP